MRTRFFALAAIAVLLLNIGGIASADTRRPSASKSQATRLIGFLPASDAVVVFDSKRFLDDSLPKLLSANQPLLDEIMGKIAEMNTHIGIDIRKFDQVVAGISIKPGAPKDFGCEPVAIASGDINAGALIALAKIASNGKYREEKFGERSVYIFTLQHPAQKTSSATTSPKVVNAIHQGLNDITEIAVTALDQNTLAFGCPTRVRETLAGTTHVGTDLTDLLFQRETAFASFALKAPVGMSNMMPLGNDEIGKDISGIRYLSGSLDVTTLGASLQLMARTDKPEQARSLKDTLEGLRMIGKAFLDNAKNPEHKLYGRLVNAAKIDTKANDVTLDILVPQADIDTMITSLKQKRPAPQQQTVLKSNGTAMKPGH